MCCACLLHVVSFCKFSDFLKIVAQFYFKENFVSGLQLALREFDLHFYLSHSNLLHVATRMHMLCCLSVFTDRDNHRFEVRGQWCVVVTVISTSFPLPDADLKLIFHLPPL